MSTSVFVFWNKSILILWFPFLKNKTKSLDYGGRVDNISALKDISPPPPTEPSIVPTEAIVQALKNQANVFKERIVTSTYIGRNIKQVWKSIFFLFKKTWHLICKIFAGKDKFNTSVSEMSNSINSVLRMIHEVVTLCEWISSIRLLSMGCITV